MVLRFFMKEKNIILKDRSERNSSFELLRIISMLLIIAHHYSVHGGFNFYTLPFSLKLYFVQCMQMGGKLGVNLFVLISGFFLCKSKFRWQRIVRLELEVLFYSVIIGLLFHIFLPERETLFGLLREFRPVFYRSYWFYTAYFEMFLISPFINRFIEKISKEMFRHLIIVITLLWVLIPLMPKSDFLWFVLLYLWAAYIRNFPEDFRHKASSCVLTGLVSFFFIFVYVFVCDKFGFREHFADFLPQDSILIFVSSIMIFIGFSKWNTGCCRFVNVIASATFGVYLIHDNYLVRQFLWIDFFKNASFINSRKILFHAVFAVISVYIVCTLIDLFRHYVLEKPLFRKIRF